MDLLEYLHRLNSDHSTYSAPWPSPFRYHVDGCHATVRSVGEMNKKERFRQIDVWSLAFVDELQSRLELPIKRLTIGVESPAQDARKLDLESLRRRVSFLAVNNAPELEISLECSGEPMSLDSREALFSRPDSEVVREKTRPRSDTNEGLYLEKDFQCFLYGADLKSRTNDRLAIFGDDFRDVKKKKLPILREFPTGVFNKQKSSKTRVLPAEFIDFVSLNKNKQLSVIELKLDDPCLEVMSQILDYALFFSAYMEKILPRILVDFFDKPGSPAKVEVKHDPFKCYVVSNIFHKKSERVSRFYATVKGEYPFELCMLKLGHEMKSKSE